MCFYLMATSGGQAQEDLEGVITVARVSYRGLGLVQREWMQLTSTTGSLSEYPA
jgi:hypothetical protein